jgi:hypothetical protein
LRGAALPALPKNIEIGGWSFEGARLQAAPYIVFEDLRQG